MLDKWKVEARHQLKQMLSTDIKIAKEGERI